MMSRDISGLVIPAAGLGTRLRPLTERTPKELLPLGGRPALWGALLEAAAAGVGRAVVVVSPAKASLRAWVEAERGRWPLEIAVAEQAAPLGALDAVEAGRRLLDGGPFAVLYPDLVSLPSQRGLAALLAGWRASGAEAAIGVYRVGSVEEASRRGASARVRWRGGAPAREGEAAALAGLEAAPLAPGAWHTTLAEVRGASFDAALHEVPGEGDGRVLGAWCGLGAAGLAAGVALPGVVLDLGVLAGYDDAVGRFERGVGAWRGGGGS